MDTDTGLDAYETESDSTDSSITVEIGDSSTQLTPEGAQMLANKLERFADHLRQVADTDT
jgi:hypothetical protein